jgi:hypothetical protein
MIPAGRTVAAALILLAPAGPTPRATAQSLGDLAREEQERRKKQGKPARTFTDSDLASARARNRAAGESPTPASPSPGPPASPAASPSPGASPRPDPLRDPQVERAWRERFSAARRSIKEAEERAWVTRFEIVFVSGIPVQQQVRRFEETEELRQARRALEDLEEELRRAGLPPGWGRE